MKSKNINEDEQNENPFGTPSFNFIAAAALVLFFELSVLYICGGLSAPPIWGIPDGRMAYPIRVLGYAIEWFYFVTGFVFVWGVTLQLIIGITVHLKKINQRHMRLFVG